MLMKICRCLKVCCSYKQKHQIHLYGRGFVAGIDVKSQKKTQSEFYNEIIEKRRSAQEKEQEKSVLKISLIC